VILSEIAAIYRLLTLKYEWSEPQLQIFFLLLNADALATVANKEQSIVECHWNKQKPTAEIPGFLENPGI